MSVPSAVTNSISQPIQHSVPQKIAEPLNYLVTKDPFAEKTSNRRWELVWKATAIVAIISTIALAAFAPYAIYSLWPFTLFLNFAFQITGVSIIAIAAIKTYVWDKSASHAGWARDAECRIKHFQNIKDSELPTRIKYLGVTPGIEPTKLKAVVAEFDYYKERQFKFIEAAKDHEPEGNFSPLNYDWNNKKDVFKIKQIQTYNSIAEHSLREAARCNLLAAYALKVIHSPREKRKIDQFLQFNDLPLRNNPWPDIFIKTKTKAYTAEELYKKDTTELARELFELAPAPVVCQG